VSAAERAPAGSAGRGKGRIFRSTGARVAGWAWLVFAAVNLVDLAVRGDDLAALVAAAVLLFGCGLAYVLGLRPRIVADETGVRLHNPLRDVRIPWPALRRIEAAQTLRLHCVAERDAGPGESRSFNAWVMQTSPRARARAQRRSRREVPDAVARHLEGRTPVDFVAEQLTELAARGRPGAGSRGDKDDRDDRDTDRPTVTWAAPAVAAVALPGAALVVLALFAALT
jgi:hypothetical protein